MKKIYVDFDKNKLKGAIPKTEAKQMGYLINSSIILIVLYFWLV